MSGAATGSRALATHRPERGAAATPDASARASKAGHVYREIKEAILAGTLQPGAPIDKAALCEKLSMSRFPITAAINRLAFERLVTIEPQHGSFVARIALRDVRECMLVRRAIEGDIAAEAARRAGPDLAEALRRNLRYQGAAVAAGDRAGLYALDVAFHGAICDGVAFHHAEAMLDGLRARLERTRRILMTPPGRMAETVAEHEAVAAAIVAGDPDGARTAMRRHLARTAALFDGFAAENPALFLTVP